MTLQPLSDLLELSDSGVWGDEDVSSGISILRSTNFNADGSLDFSKLALRTIEERKRASKLLAPGDILLEKSGGGPKQPVGRVCLFRGDSQPHSFGNFIARLRVRQGLLPEYLFFFLWHFHAIGRTSHYQKQTTGIRNLEFKRFLSIDVPVCSLPEQRRIVDLLTRAEGIVRLRREAAAKAAELIPALFIHHFGDPATNPMGWPVRPLGDGLLAADYGCSTKAHAEGEGVPLIRMGNVTYAGDMDLSDLKFVHLDAAEQTKYELLEGDLLFNRTNSKELVGKTGLWSGQRDAVVASYFIRLRVDPQVFTPTYVWAFMNSKHMKKVLFETARGAIGQANINSKELKSFPVPTPPIEIQTALGERVVAVQSIVAQQTTALAKAQATFDALLAQAFAPT